jgi:indolepyruvate ferredoxin oxidoreductase, beta subunit
MKTDIILSGVGGQGILSIAAVIGEAALKEGLYMKQAEVHGMSQRGGDVQSNLRLSDEPIASDLIPKGHADLIISLEPMESLRYLPYLKKEGWLVTNSRPFVNIPNYPEIEKVNAELDKLPHKVVLDVEEIAKKPFNCSSTTGYPSSNTKISLHSPTIFSTCFLGSGYWEIFNTGCSKPSG